MDASAQFLPRLVSNWLTQRRPPLWLCFVSLACLSMYTLFIDDANLGELRHNNISEMVMGENTQNWNYRSSKKKYAEEEELLYLISRRKEGDRRLCPPPLDLPMSSSRSSKILRGGWMWTGERFHPLHRPSSSWLFYIFKQQTREQEERDFFALRGSAGVFGWIGLRVDGGWMIVLWVRWDEAMSTNIKWV